MALKWESSSISRRLFLIRNHRVNPIVVTRALHRAWFFIAASILPRRLKLKHAIQSSSFQAQGSPSRQSL